MNDTLDYYQLLHVSPDAPAEIIRASYRALMQAMKRHPDLGGDHDDAALLNEAYATLVDPVKRKAYDAHRQRRRAAAPPRKAPATVDTVTAVAVGQGNRTLVAQQCPFCNLPHTLGADIAADAICGRCAAPLRSVTRESASAVGKRALDRYPKRAPVRVAVAWPGPQLQCTSLDVSLQGMLLESEQALVDGAVIKLSCELLDATGRVVHVRDLGSCWQAGVEFVTLRFVQARGGFVSTRA